jgi:hypothetical protein
MSDDSYDQARHRFDELDLEGQTRFLIEASASTLARGLECVGQTLADELGDMMRPNGRPSARSGDAGPGAAEPETSHRRAPRNGSTSADT